MSARRDHRLVSEGKRFSHSGPHAVEKQPVRWPRDSDEYARLRAIEYAYVAHRWPYVEELERAQETTLDPGDCVALVKILAEEFEVPDVRVDFGDGRGSYAWKHYWTEGRRWEARPRILLGARGRNVRTVVHEFAHLISDGEIEHLDPSDRHVWVGATGGGYLRRSHDYRRQPHREAFIEAMVAAFDAVRGLWEEDA